VKAIVLLATLAILCTFHTFILAGVGVLFGTICAVAIVAIGAVVAYACFDTLLHAIKGNP